MKRFYARKGFSLIELSVVLTILSVVIAGVLPGISGAGKSRDTEVTQSRMTAIDQALLAFRIANKRLPCPSNVTINEGVTNFGVEGANPGSCTGGTPAATYAPTGNAAGGGVPVRTLGLPDEYANDAWGRRFDYNVDERFTATNATDTYPPSDTTVGTFTVKDQGGVNRTTKAVYVLISHGPDGHGGFINGATRYSRGITYADTLTNCNCTSAGVYNAYGATYVQRPRYLDSTNSLNAFDDLVTYKLRSQVEATSVLGSLWSANGTTNLYPTNNTTTNGVAIGQSSNSIGGFTPMLAVTSADAANWTAVIQSTATGGGAGALKLDTSSGFGLYSTSTATGASGVIGVSTSDTGTGVNGITTAGTGSATGVSGSSASVSGAGVYGTATGASSIGVRASSTGTSGVGVSANVSGTSGVAVTATATASSGNTTGVSATANSSAGTGVSGSGGQNGVYGIATATTGKGLYGISNGTSGFGVYGSAAASTGATYGVYGASASTSGMGVRGEATNASGTGTYGVYGNSAATTSGAGVNGTGGYIGVNGSAPGYGVVGIATAASPGIGVYGYKTNTGIIGVRGYYDATHYCDLGTSTLGLSCVGDGTLSGNMTAAAYYYTSDRRLKDHISDFKPSETESIMRLRPVRYHLKSEGENGRQHIGLIAQEVKEIYPQLVGERNDPDGKTYMTVDYASLTVPLIDAVQKLQKENDELRARLDTAQGGDIMKQIDQLRLLSMIALALAAASFVYTLRCKRK